MFEDSLVESRVGHLSSSKRWTALASIGLQATVAAVVIALPLLHPEALPSLADAPRVLMPVLQRPPAPAAQMERVASASSTAAAPILMRPLILSSLPSLRADRADAPPLAPVGWMGSPNGLPGGIVGDGSGSTVTCGGSVVVEATISRTGAIESLHVMSGPPMLRGAAMDAIRAARYEPFRLNGEPTEVQTTITVNFRMGG